ncbi:phage tail domain-containing protein [Paenibacillus wenxiniae]
MELGFYATGASKRPMLPVTIDRTLVIPGTNGAYNFGADLGTRTIEYDCRFIEQDYLKLQQVVMELAAYLLDSFGKPRTLVLQQVERPGQSITVQYSGQIDLQRIMGTGVFNLPLLAHDPYFYSDEQLVERSVTSSPQVIEIQSSGTIRTDPYIVFTNTGSNTINRIRLTNEVRVE